MSEITRRSLLAAASGLTVAAAQQQPGPQRPNVVFYFDDQVRTNELGYNGGQNIATPNIDRFASQGCRFTNAISSYPLCTPYRAMLQTGRWPSLSGGVMNWINLPSTGQSFADVFSRGGYQTAYVGKWHLAAGRLAGTLKRGNPPRQIAESEYVPPGPARMGYQHWAAWNFHTAYRRPFYYRDTPERLYFDEYETAAITSEAMRFIGGRDTSKPFFLMMAPHPPHPPWKAESTPEGSLDRIRKDLHWRANTKGRRDTRAQDPRCYFAMLQSVDEQFGRMMKFLDESKLADNTIVVFTSDHGEMMASQSRYDKMVPYCEALNIPMIVRWPGRIQAGRQCDTIFTPIDHLPSLATMCGLETPSIVNGKNLSEQVLHGRGSDPEDALIMNMSSHWDYPETMTMWPEWRGIRTKQHTYVRWLDGAEELYDNSADPLQFRNLYDGRKAPAAMEHSRTRLKELLEEAHDLFPPGTEYLNWFNLDRNLIRNALGPIHG